MHAWHAPGAADGRCPHHRVRWQHRRVHPDRVGDVARIDARTPLGPGLYYLTTRRMGRVFTTFSTGAMASAMAGMAGFGWVADAIGPATSLLGIGMLLLGTATVAAAFSRRHPDRTAPDFIPA